VNNYRQLEIKLSQSRRDVARAKRDLIDYVKEAAETKSPGFKQGLQNYVCELKHTLAQRDYYLSQLQWGENSD